MLIIGGIYKCKTDSYIVIIEKVNYVYCYEILTNTLGKDSINNEEIRDILMDQINYGLQKQHNFFFRGKEKNLEEIVDGYLGQITDEQRFNLSIELSYVIDKCQ